MEVEPGIKPVALPVHPIYNPPQEQKTDKTPLPWNSDTIKATLQLIKSEGGSAYLLKDSKGDDLPISIQFTKTGDKEVGTTISEFKGWLRQSQSEGALDESKANSDGKKMLAYLNRGREAAVKKRALQLQEKQTKRDEPSAPDSNKPTIEDSKRPAG